MIRHCVMLTLEETADRSELDRVMLELATLVEGLDGCTGFRAGPNRDYEGKSPDIAYGFIFDADTPDALAAYAVHPEHIALSAQLISLCKGGGRGVVIYDLEVGP